MFASLKGLLCKAVVGTVLGVVSLTVVGIGSARADYPAYYQPAPCYTVKKIVTYETVISYEIRREPYRCDYTLYDECYRPYTVSRTCYRDVKVAVKTVVPVVKYVKVYD